MTSRHTGYWSPLATAVCGVINNDIIACSQQAATADENTPLAAPFISLTSLFIIPRASNLPKQKNWF